MKRENDIEPLPATTFTVTVDDEEVRACEGETVLHLLLALGRVSISTRNDGSASGAYCGMGVCFACTVCIDGVHGQRACQRPVREGMSIRTHCNALAEPDILDDTA